MRMRRLLRWLRRIDLKLRRKRVGEWQPEPVMRNGIACVWMLTVEGEYAYRPMDEVEQREWVKNDAW